MANPINKENAIESCNFSLVFERVFNKQELLSLSRLEQFFKDDLPLFQKINSINLKLIDGISSEQSQEVSGVVLQCFKTNGKTSWELKVENNIFEVTCFEYTNWTAVWEKTQRYLLETISTLENNNKLLVCSLKTIDKFLSDENNYLVNDIFSSDTLYLTQRILNDEKNKLWHVFQGWFEQSDTKTYLQNLNIITALEENKIVTTIDHSTQCHFFKNPQLIINFKNSELTTVFHELHEKNKEILKKLLNTTQLERIGL